MIFINRYGERFSFELASDGNILWRGKFEWCRHAWANTYEEAYAKYVEDDCDSSAMMTMGEFQVAVHETDENGLTPFARKYGKYVTSDTSTITMLDPSGGPYISKGQNMGYFDDEFEGMIVERLERVDEGLWKVIIKKDGSTNSSSNGE